MSVVGVILMLGSALILLLLAAMAGTELLRLRAAWRHRDVADNGCRYPECVSPDEQRTAQ